MTPTDGSEAIAETVASVSGYPLATCVVTGEALDSMDGMVEYPNDHGPTVRFCCKDCIETFEKDPTKYLAVLNATTTKAAAPEQP